MGPVWPQDGAKTAPRWPKRAPRWPQEGAKRAFKGPAGIKSTLFFPCWLPRGPKRAPRAPQEGPKRAQEASKRAPRGPQEGHQTLHTTQHHDTRHTTHRAQQAALFLERRARRGPKTTPTTTHDSTHATRSMGGAVLGMTGATRPKNHTPITPNTAHDAPCTRHYKRRGSFKHGRGEDQEPHAKPSRWTRFAMEGGRVIRSTTSGCSPQGEQKTSDTRLSRSAPRS